MQAPEGVDVGAIVAGVDRGVDLARSDQGSDCRLLAAATRRAELEDLAAPARLQPFLARAGRDLLRSRLGRALVFGAAPVQRLDRTLVLGPQARRGQRTGVDAGEELARRRLLPAFTGGANGA